MTRPDGLDGLMAEVAALGSLREGWDGERAAAPSMSSVADALRLVRLLGSDAAGFEASLHVDGTVILERDGASLRLMGDGTAAYATPAGTGRARVDDLAHGPGVLPPSGHGPPTPP